MKELLLLFICSLTILVGHAQIKFEEGDFNSVVAKATREGKMIFVDCYTSWCGPCKLLSKNIFSTKDAGDYFNPKYVCWKIDMEKGEGLELANRFSPGAYPTLLLLNSDGTEHNRAVGSTQTVAEFIAKIEDAVAPEMNVVKCREKFDADPLYGNEYVRYLDGRRDNKNKVKAIETHRPK